MNKADAIKEAIELAKKTKLTNTEQTQDSENHSQVDEKVEPVSQPETTKNLSRD